MNVYTFSGSDPFMVFAEASILMNCKIQILWVQTNISVCFTPPEMMDEYCQKILYYYHQNFAMCQTVVEIRTSEDRDSSKQMEPNLAEECLQKKNWRLFRDYFVIARYSYSQCIYEVDIYTSFTVLQKFEKLFEKIPQDSSIAFIFILGNAPFVPVFVRALSRQFGRKAPIDAKNDPDIVQTWLSNNEPRTDLIAHSSALKNMKTKFITNLSSNLLTPEEISATQNVTSQYTHICLPAPSKNEHKAMIYFSSEKHSDQDWQKNWHRQNLKNYLRRTNFY